LGLVFVVPVVGKAATVITIVTGIVVVGCVVAVVRFCGDVAGVVVAVGRVVGRV
jgi:hypothetical protein